MVAMMLNATRDLELKEAQKTTIDGLQDEARKHDESSKTDFKEYRALIAAGVKEGKIDTAKLAPLKANMDKAMQARKDKDAETLNALYGALEPAQRKALVASIRSKEAERKARGEARKGEDSKPAEADWKKRRTEHLTKELELDATQQKSIEALFAKGEHPSPASMDTMREEMKKRTDALYTAFEAEGFDAKKLDLWPAPPKKMGEASDKQVQALSQLIAILKPEQRQKLAARMSEGPGSRRFGYPVDDESGVGYFFDGPHQREEPAPPKP
jgi:Spy/CpxP family protein refolding chaperone